MAQINISLTITTPVGITTAEAVRLFSEHHHYSQSPLAEGLTQQQFAKKILAQIVLAGIKERYKKELEEALNTDPGITVD